VPVAGRPHDIRVSGIGQGEPGFATSHVTIPAGFLRINGYAGTTHVPVVLHVAVEVVGHLVIDCDVIHLADRQRDAVEPATVHGGDEHAAIVGDDEAVGVGGVDPDVVGIAPPA